MEENKMKCILVYLLSNRSKQLHFTVALKERKKEIFVQIIMEKLFVVALKESLYYANYFIVKKNSYIYIYYIWTRVYSGSYYNSGFEPI